MFVKILTFLPRFRMFARMTRVSTMLSLWCSAAGATSSAMQAKAPI